jgi:DNA-binding HxlR family transcriptional regulator
MNCSLAQALEVLGERWTLLILRDAFRGSRRFDDFLSLGIARNVLTTRLNTLVAHGILEKRAVDGKSSDYLLTEKGLDLQPILLSLTHWGDKYVPDPKGRRLDFVEKATGEPIREMSATSRDGRPLSAREIRAVPGPALEEHG